MNAATPKPNRPQVAAAPQEATPAPPTERRRTDSEPPLESERVAAPLSDDFERHDTIPAPTWFDEAPEPAN